MNLDKLINDGVRGLAPYEPGKPIEELERELNITNIVKLASNENPLGISPRVSARITKEVASLSRYPDGSAYHLKRQLAAFYSVDDNQITLGNGSNEVLEIIFRTFVSSGDEVIYSQYAFVVYQLLTQACAATHRAIPAVDYGHDLAGMLAAINGKTKLICIANPNNPTGTFIGAKALDAFLEKVPSHILVVIDEAYGEYLADNEQTDIRALLDKYSNVIICRTFSKAYGLAGLRIGAAYSSGDIAVKLNCIREPFNNNHLALVAAEEAIKDQDFVAQSAQLNREEMGRLTAFFDANGIEYIPSKGNFITIDLKREPMPYYQALLRKGVIVRPVMGYGLKTHLRISIGLASENDAFMQSFKQIEQELN